MKFMVVPIGHNVFWLAKFGLELLVSDLFMAVPVGQNISGLPDLELALTYANITTGRMLWQYFKFVRKYACCTNSLSDLAYAMYLRRSQPFAYAVPGRLPAKDGYAQDPRLLVERPEVQLVLFVRKTPSDRGSTHGSGPLRRS